MKGNTPALASLTLISEPPAMCGPILQRAARVLRSAAWWCRLEESPSRGGSRAPSSTRCALGESTSTSQPQRQGRHRCQINGNRVELGAVDSHIARITGMPALVKQSPEDPNKLVAYVEAPHYVSTASNEGWSLFSREAAHELRTALLDCCDKHSIPVQYVAMRVLPTTKQSGKLNRKALPEVSHSLMPAGRSETANAESPEPHECPVTELVLNLVRTTVGVPSITAEDAFFTYMDSVTGGTFISELREIDGKIVDGLELSTDAVGLMQLFGATPTPALLAQSVIARSQPDVADKVDKSLELDSSELERWLDMMDEGPMKEAYREKLQREEAYFRGHEGGGEGWEEVLADWEYGIYTW